jgi:DNA mismatch repair protein MSH3
MFVPLMVLGHIGLQRKQYIIEVKKNENRTVPANWHISSRYISLQFLFELDVSCLFRTKSATRYHTPEVKKKLQERAQHKEALEMEARKAFSAFLDEIAQGHYGILRNAVNKLAIADCLLSLARVALQEGYVRPEFTEDDTLEIVEGMQYS